jgi:hypothetical protein
VNRDEEHDQEKRRVLSILAHGTSPEPLRQVAVTSAGEVEPRYRPRAERHEARVVDHAKLRGERRRAARVARRGAGVSGVDRWVEVEFPEDLFEKLTIVANRRGLEVGDIVFDIVRNYYLDQQETD